MIEQESQKIEAFTSQLYQKSILEATNGKISLRDLTLLAHLSNYSIIEDRIIYWRYYGTKINTTSIR